VDDSLISKIDIPNYPDAKYKDLLNIEMIDIRRKQSIIRKNVKTLYTKTTTFRHESANAKLVSICYNFNLLERKLDDYISEQQK
jgi:hypothetical protein